MEKNYIYVLTYDINKKQVVVAATPNYKVAQYKKTWYDQHLGREGKIKKLRKGLDK